MKKSGLLMMPAVAAIGMFSSAANAAYITGVSGNAGTSGIGTVTSTVTITGPGSFTPNNDDANPSTNVVDFDVAAFAPAKFFLDVNQSSPTLSAGSTAPPAPLTEWLFTIDFKNSTGAVVQGIFVDLAKVAATLGAGLAFDPNTNGTIIDATHMKFDGLNLAPGATTSLVLSVDVPDLPNAPNANAIPAWRLGVTAIVPEPASMALAGLACCGIGGVVSRRRRKNQTTDVAV